MGFGATIIQSQKERLMKIVKTESSLRKVIIDLIKMKNKLVRDVEIWRWVMGQLRQRDQVGGSKGQQHESRKKILRDSI